MLSLLISNGRQLSSTQPDKIPSGNIPVLKIGYEVPEENSEPPTIYTVVSTRTATHSERGDGKEINEVQSPRVWVNPEEKTNTRRRKITLMHIFFIITVESLLQ
jgi:hypothetical protein